MTASTHVPDPNQVYAVYDVTSICSLWCHLPLSDSCNMFSDLWKFPCWINSLVQMQIMGCSSGCCRKLSLLCLRVYSNLYIVKFPWLRCIRFRCTDSFAHQFQTVFCLNKDHLLFKVFCVLYKNTIQLFWKFLGCFIQRMWKPVSLNSTGHLFFNLRNFC